MPIRHFYRSTSSHRPCAARTGGAAKAIEAMRDDTLAELGDRLELVLIELREAKYQHPNFADLMTVATRVRYTLRHRRARAALDALLA